MSIPWLQLAIIHVVIWSFTTKSSHKSEANQVGLHVIVMKIKWYSIYDGVQLTEYAISYSQLPINSISISTSQSQVQLHSVSNFLFSGESKRDNQQYRLYCWSWSIICVVITNQNQPRWSSKDPHPRNPQRRSIVKIINTALQWSWVQPRPAPVCQQSWSTSLLLVQIATIMEMIHKALAMGMVRFSHLLGREIRHW